ncbi:MAG: baseplate J/gp47 family protein [bacterium]|nr:baseplate J/gp47 family protein [bacterium]
MAIMSDKIKATLLAQLGINKDWANNEIQAQVTGGPLANILQAATEPVFELVRVVLSAAWQLFYEAMGLLMPQLFLRYASGHWLDERALDDGLVREPGQKTRLTLNLTKAAGVPLSIDAGTEFFISESNPRRYAAVGTVTPLEGDTAFSISVEALCPVATDEYDTGREIVYSADYNAPTGLTWECSAALPLDSISYDGGGYLVIGTDPETDEALRERVYAKRALGSVNPGGVLYYIAVFSTLPGVVHVTHDATDTLTAKMTYTLYGASGALDPQILTDAEALVNEKKIETDTIEVQLAQPEYLSLILSVKNGPVDDELITAVSNHFEALERGQDYEEGSLYASLFAEFSLIYPSMVLRLNTGYAQLPPGTYWVPQTAIELLP